MASDIIGGVGKIPVVPLEIDKLPDEKKDGTSFTEFLKDALNKTNDLQIESQKLQEDFAAGRTDNIHQVMIAAEKADIALQFTIQIRNKILDAYNEIMRMQI